jgi:hypothetical protein
LTKCHVTNHTENFLSVKKAESYLGDGFSQPGAEYHFVTMEEGPFLDHMNKEHREPGNYFPYKAGQCAMLSKDENDIRVRLHPKEAGHSKLSSNNQNPGGHQHRTRRATNSAHGRLESQHKEPHSSQRHGKSQEGRKKPKRFLGRLLGGK